MKIRSRFVSNSSTSSFICVGVQVPYDVKHWDNYAVFLGTAQGFVLGNQIGGISSDSIHVESMSILELQTYVNEVAEKLNVHSDEIKLFFGVKES